MYMSKYKLYLEGKLGGLFKPTNIDKLPDNWIKNPDGTYDVDGDVNLSEMGFKKLPYKFNKINGNFWCSHNKLISLEGCPKEIGDTFDCRDNTKAFTIEEVRKICDVKGSIRV